MLNNQIQVFGINLNAQHVNEMTHFDCGKLVLLLDTLEY